MASLTEQDRKGGKVTFVASHQAAFPAGQYTITVEQKIHITGVEPVEETFSSKKQNFIVQAPRFALNPQQIQAVFPPAGSLGDHANILPHVMLTPSTLPWERSGAKPADVETPWLALLLFTEEELARFGPGDTSDRVRSITLEQYRQDQYPNDLASVTQALEADLAQGQHQDDSMSVIAVPAGLLRQIMPTQADLRWLTHVRQATDNAGKLQGQEVAVIMANRLPQPKGISVIHLVSVEEGYGGETFGPAENSPDETLVRLVSLKSWRFACLDENQSFSGLLKKVHQQTFRLADNTNNEDADHYLKRGHVPLPHAMRQGNKSVSWYRGPLLPGRNTTPADVSLPVRTADALVRYNPTLGMFDVSYAAAWELGRLLMLRAKNVSLDLYHWKRGHAQKLKDAEHQIAHLPFDGPSADLDLPPSVCSWFERTALLQGVPFHYLVADEQLLPRESIRFFQIDWPWVECMLDGAYSIGRVLTRDHQRERALSRQQIDLPHPQMSGFLLRSEVVSGWSHVLIDGYEPGYLENNPATETKQLFSLTDKTFAQQLAEAGIDDLRAAFQINGVMLSSDVTIEQRCWVIGDPITHEVTQIENNQLDVRQIGQVSQYHFTLDESFKADLQAGQVSESLRQVLSRQKVEVSAGWPITVTRWFIADQEQQVYFIVERDGDVFNIYRDFKLPLLRLERLSNSVLICLFEGIVQVVDIHLKPETIHHGVDYDEKTKTYSKKVRNNDGQLQDQIPPVPVSFRESNGRVLEIASLVKALSAQQTALGFQEFTVAQFALQMVENTPKVRFMLSPKPPTGT